MRPPGSSIWRNVRTARQAVAAAAPDSVAQSRRSGSEKHAASLSPAGGRSPPALFRGAKMAEWIRPEGVRAFQFLSVCSISEWFMGLFS